MKILTSQKKNNSKIWQLSRQNKQKTNRPTFVFQIEFFPFKKEPKSTYLPE